LPTVTYIGKTVWRMRPDIKENWERNQPVEVTQEWLDTHRIAICTNPTAFKVEGDAGATVDQEKDGIPDEGWTKKDISAWLKDKGGEVSGYMTKTKMLGMVGNVLNPKAVEENELGEEPTQQNGDE